LIFCTVKGGKRKIRAWEGEKEETTATMRSMKEKKGRFITEIVQKKKLHVPDAPENSHRPLEKRFAKKGEGEKGGNLNFQSEAQKKGACSQKLCNEMTCQTREGTQFEERIYSHREGRHPPFQEPWGGKGKAAP